MNRFRRGLRWFFSIALAAVALYGIALAFPEPLFGHRLQSSAIELFSRRPFESELGKCFAEPLARAQASEIFDSSVRFRIFELGSAGWNRFFNGPYAGAMARHSELGGNIFVPTIDSRRCLVEHFDGRQASIAVVIAHEMVHRLMQERLGVVRVWRLPWWKREGYAEFVAERDTVPLAERVARLGTDRRDTRYPTRLLEALIAVRYLKEVKHLSFDEFIASSDDLAAVWTEMQDNLAESS